MSSMLEQAIVDAQALREAALKNAEQSVIEKYAPEIKAAVESLLEGKEVIEEQIADEAHSRKFGAQNNFTNFLRQDVLNQMTGERLVNSKF